MKISKIIGKLLKRERVRKVSLGIIFCVLVFTLYIHREARKVAETTLESYRIRTEQRQKEIFDIEKFELWAYSRMSCKYSWGNIDENHFLEGLYSFEKNQRMIFCFAAKRLVDEFLSEAKTDLDSILKVDYHGIGDAVTNLTHTKKLIDKILKDYLSF